MDERVGQEVGGERDKVVGGKKREREKEEREYETGRREIHKVRWRNEEKGIGGKKVVKSGKICIMESDEGEEEGQEAGEDRGAGG